MLHYRSANDIDLGEIYDLYMDEPSNPFLTYDLMEKDAFKPIFRELVNSGTLFVVQSGEEVVATYRLIPKAFRQAHVYYLGSFVTKKGLQGRGIGSEVLAHICDDAKQEGKKRIELTVDLHNATAIHLYQKAGFEIEGVVKKSYRLQSTGEYYNEYLMGLTW